MIKTTPQRAERALRLLLGMRLPQVVDALLPFGFSHEVVTEGWALMAALTPPRDDAQGCQKASTSALTAQESMERLKDFSATWFPVVSAVLSRHFPAQERLLFRNIGVPEGQMAFMTVMVFVNRLQEMQHGTKSFGEDGPAAWKAVESRGLSEAMVEEALRVATGALTPAARLSSRRSAEREEQANLALWGWYLEWSRIVRKAVTNKSLLRSMGFSPPKAKGSTGVPQTPALKEKRRICND